MKDMDMRNFLIFSQDHRAWKCVAPYSWFRPVLLLLCLVSLPAAAASEWPQISLPQSLRVFEIGGDKPLSVNGVPMKLQGFYSNASQAQVAAWFRRDSRKSYAEHAEGGKIIFSRAHGEFFVTVQVESYVQGSKGFVAVSNLGAAGDGRGQNLRDRERLLARLPAGSELINQVSSYDGGRESSQWVALNDFGEKLNREHIKEYMRSDGMALDREVSVDGNANSMLKGAVPGAVILYFNGKGKEAVAVVYRDHGGRTTVVVNTVVNKVSSE
ncbi:MAG: hypothetical protein ACT4NV_09220 [Rhodoferax sp.]